MQTATFEYLKDLAQRLEQAKHGQKQKLIIKASQFLNCSKAQVYRQLEDAGLSPKTKTGRQRKTRSDKGKTIITHEQAVLISGAILSAKKTTGKSNMSIKDSSQIMQANGKIPLVSASTVSRALKQHHLHPEQLNVPKAHVRQRSLYPNHVWQIDPSVCVLFYLPKDKGGGLSVMDEKEFYKNKPANIAKTLDQRVTRYVICDHYSGAIYVEYVHGTESSENLTQVFLNAIQRRSSNDLIHGIPDILIMDKGSANTSKLFLNLLDRLGIQHFTHAVGNSRAKGAVEKANDIVETKFESMLALLKINSLAQLNQQATAWRIYFNEHERHTRHGKTRNMVWYRIVEMGKLKLAPRMDICQELVTTIPKSFKVLGDLTITHTVKGYPNQSYNVSHLPNIHPKAEVHIVVNAYRIPDVDVMWQGKTYTVRPMQKDAAGFDVNAQIIGEGMTSQKENIVDKNLKQIFQQSYGVSTQLEVDKARKNRQVAFNGEINPMAHIQQQAQPHYPAIQGEKVNVSEHLQLRFSQPLSYVEAAQTIKAQVGELWTSEHYQYLCKKYPNGVPYSEIDIIVERIQNNTFFSQINIIEPEYYEVSTATQAPVITTENLTTPAGKRHWN